MDKQNYTLTNMKNQELENKIGEIYKKMEKKLAEKEIIKRKRKVKDCWILVKAVFLRIVHNLSFQRLSDLMSCKYDVTMSDTAWSKQIKKVADAFIEAAEECLKESYEENAAARSDNVLNQKHCYALDATNLAVEGKNATVIRMHVQYMLDSAYANFVSITDNHVAESILNFPIESSALYIADRAYGKIRQLEYLIRNNAGFVIRISPNHIILYQDMECSKKIDFSDYISGDDFSLNCFGKYMNHVFPIRIIGMKKPDDKLNASEKKVRRKAQKNQTKLSQKTINFSKWLFLAVSPDNSIPAEDIFGVYRLRWQIELFFKRMKSILQLRKIRHSSDVYAACIAKLWFAVGLLISSVKLSVANSLPLEISEFNLFSLIVSFFA